MSDFGNFVDTVTQDRIIPKVTDNVLNGNVALLRFLGKNRRTTSGTELKLPIKYQSSTSGGWYSNFDTFDTSQKNTRAPATFKPKQIYFSVPISGIQVAVNKGPEKVLDLLSTEMQSVSDDMADTLGTGFYSDGSGTSSKQLTGLAAAVNDGTDTATYAGLLRSTYTTWVSNEDASSNSITLAEIGASFEAAKHGTDAPTIAFTTPAIFSTIESLLQATLQWNNPVTPYGKVTREGVERNGETGVFGVDALFYRGKPIVADEKCTANTFWWINERHMWIYTWPYPDFPGYVAKPNYNGFAWTGLKLPLNQDASVGQFLFYGQLVTDSCRSHSYMTGKS